MINHVKRNIIYYSILFVLLVMIANYLLLYGRAEMGQYGDIFGMSNALFTGIALSFLIYGVFLQRDELKIAKEDLERTKDILSDQTNHLRRQEFNSQFFELLNICGGFIISLDYYNRKGNVVIKYIYSIMYKLNISGENFIKNNMGKEDIEYAIQFLKYNKSLKMQIYNETLAMSQIINMILSIIKLMHMSRYDTG